MWMISYLFVRLLYKSYGYEGDIKMFSNGFKKLTNWVDDIYP